MHMHTPSADIVRQFSRGGCLCWSLVADGAVASFVVHSMLLVVALDVTQLPSDASVSSEVRPLMYCESRGSSRCCSISDVEHLLEAWNVIG